MQAHLGRDAFVSGLRGVRIWGEAQLRMGQGTIERWTAFAGKSGSRFLDYFVIKTRVRDKDCVKNRVKRAKIVRFTLC